MSDEIRNIRVTADLIKAIPGVGQELAEKIVRQFNTLGAFLDVNTESFSVMYPELSAEATAELLGWANNQAQILTEDEVDEEEEVLDGETPAGIDPVIGPEEHGLAITEIRPAGMKIRTVVPQQEDVVEIRPIHNKKIVVRKG